MESMLVNVMSTFIALIRTAARRHGAGCVVLGCTDGSSPAATGSPCHFVEFTSWIICQRRACLASCSRMQPSDNSALSRSDCRIRYWQNLCTAAEIGGCFETCLDTIRQPKNKLRESAEGVCAARECVTACARVRELEENETRNWEIVPQVAHALAKLASEVRAGCWIMKGKERDCH